MQNHPDTGPRHVFAVDFDGVLCDSAAESAVAAWRAGGRLWPDCQGAEPPEACRQRFIRLRPLIETGYQTVLLTGLIARGLDEAAIAARFAELCQALLQEIGRSRTELDQLFGAVRDAWIAQDPQDWLGRQRFYPVIDTFAEKIKTDPVFILTTKQARFVRTLLEGYGIAFPDERIFGLDSGRKKEEILEQLLERPEYRNAVWHFVEDRLATLLRIAGRERLQGVRLYLADWGYNTARDREQARRHPAITVWNPRQFLAVQSDSV